MNQKVWIGLAVATILGLTFWSGQLYERGINAPGVAAARAKTDALEGEKKVLNEQLEAEQQVALDLQVKMSKTEKAHADSRQVPVLLGVDPVWGPIVGYRTDNHTDSEANTNMGLDGLLTGTARSRSSLDVAADRQAGRFMAYAAGGWEAAEWDSVEGWKRGAPAVSLGVMLQPFLWTTRKSFDGSGRLETEIGFLFH